MVINIFCDASIDLNTKTACGGCYIVGQESDSIFDIGAKNIIQFNATNNSAEILAIWAGITEGLKLRSKYPGGIFRLFSDSKVSLYGLRDWIKFWIPRMKKDGTLISSSGQPVINQQRFIDIFNLIVENNFRVEFYHQRGHVKEKNMSSNIARAFFIKANKVAPEALGLNIDIISSYNDKIDKFTREAIYLYLSNNVLAPYTEIEGISPFDFRIRDSMLYQYIRCIDKTTVVSRHDFKGGYNQ